MKNYYKNLGLNNSATQKEIKRAYRILARRYHPDVNPDLDTAERFKAISEAYQTLSDPVQREQYDQQLESFEKKTADRRYQAYTQEATERFRAQSRHAEFIRQQATQAAGSEGKQSQTAQTKSTEDLLKTVRANAGTLIRKLKDVLVHPLSLKKTAASALQRKLRPTAKSGKNVRQVSLIEVSLSIEDAIAGIRKTIEIDEPGSSRKISVKIPAGVKTGDIVRMRSKAASEEELVLIIRVARHPFLSLTNKGLIVELPISLSEAFRGARITVPTLDDQVVIKIPAGTQSGTEFRLKHKGVQLRDGTRGDLYYRVLVKIPEAANGDAIVEKVEALNQCYKSPVRSDFPSRLIG